MNVNRSAEYIVLWKSRKRAEWEALRLDRQASALGQPGTRRAAQQTPPESQRMWQLCAELDSELEQVAAALTPRQRQSAEKVLKQWEREEKERIQQGG